MNLTIWDAVLFILFFSVTIVVCLRKSRAEQTGENYFLAGRKLTWPVIGISLIAANISTEHFVGLAGQGAGSIGFAIASYEWVSSACMVLIAIFLLPRFLRAGLYTMPEFLEYRFNATARTLMAAYTVLIYVFVAIAAVIYSGGLTLQTLFGDTTNASHLLLAITVVTVISTAYTVWGGLKAIAWADVFLGSTLLLGGLAVMILGFRAIGGLEPFLDFNAPRMHLILPASNPVLPWTALIVGIGLWIPCLYYWGLNQYITQRTLAAESLRQGQYGVIFAAILKATIPFLIVWPGMMAVQLYPEDLTGPGGKPDQAYALLIKNLIGPGLRGLILATVAGAVISTLSSMLNSAATIFTIDLYQRHWRPDAGNREIVRVGRWTTLVFVLIGAGIAPFLGRDSFQGIFNYIQEFQGFLSPGVFAAFLFGMVVKKAPRSTGVVAMILSPAIYLLTMILFGNITFFKEVGITIMSISFLDRMTISFVIIVLVMAVMTWRAPLSQPIVMPERASYDMRPAAGVTGLGIVVLIGLAALYVVFW